MPLTALVMPCTCFTCEPSTPSSAEPTCCSILPMIMTLPSTLPLPLSERIRSAWLSPAPVALRLSDSGPLTWLPAMPPPITWPDLDLVHRDLGIQLGGRRAGVDRGAAEVEAAAIDLALQGLHGRDAVAHGDLGDQVVDLLVGHDQRLRGEVDVRVLVAQRRQVERFLRPGRAALAASRRSWRRRLAPWRRRRP